MASLVEIQRLVQQIKDDLPLLINRSQIAPKQIVTVTGLSDISERLGLLQAGEFRSGNGLEPGFGFSGVRLGYPAFSYAGDTYNFVGVNNDELQVGISADDGKLYFGAGVGILAGDGITIIAGGSLSDDIAYKFIDDSGEIAGGLYCTVDANDNTFIRLRAPGVNGGQSQTTMIEAVASVTAIAKMTVDTTLSGVGAVILQQNLSATTLEFSSIDSVDFNAAVPIFTEQGSDPSTPASGDWKLFFKSGGLYYIDDAGSVTGPLGITLWPFGVYGGVSPWSTTGVPYMAGVDRTITFVSLATPTYVSTTNDGSNYWNIKMYRENDGTLLATLTTQSNSPDTAVLETTTSFDVASVSASAVSVYIQVSKTGTPGNLYIGGPILQVST